MESQGIRGIQRAELSKATCVATALFALGLYSAAYFVMRWQHVLVRSTFNEYADGLDGRLYATSCVGTGKGYGEESLERLRAMLTGPVYTIFRPLCAGETEIRNRYFRVVRTADGEVDSFLGVNTQEYFGIRH